MTLSGVLAYAFHILAARALGPEAYGQVAVLWAAMFLVVVVAFRPLEQTTARAISDRLARGQEVESVLRSVVLIYAVMLVAGAVLALAAWEITTQRLFLGNDAMTAALFGGIAGYGIAYVVRGVCAGARWFGGYSAILIVDAVVRLLVALPLLIVASTTCAGVRMRRRRHRGCGSPRCSGAAGDSTSCAAAAVDPASRSARRSGSPHPQP